jgi:outer membrane receptor for ferrienterochelin and colicins
LWTVFAALCCYAAGSLPAAADATCDVRGVVVDSSGGVLPGAAVVLPGRPGPEVTGPEGTFCVEGLPGGSHVLEVSLAGFVTRRVQVTAPHPSLLTVTLTPGLRADIVVTATRTSRRLDDVPVRTEVISRDLMDRAGARTLADAVEYTTGVRVENNCQNCNFSQIRLLGLEGPYTQILVDGQPVVSSLAQVYGIEQIPARMIERVEVVKGGGSALYGPGSVGGVVNIIPREPPRSGGLFELRSDTFGGQLANANWSANGSADWVAKDKQTLLTGFAQVDRVAPYDVDGDSFTEVSRRALDSFGARLNRYQLGGRGKLTVDLLGLHEARRGGDRLDRVPHESQIAEWIDSRRLSLSATWFHSVSRRFDYRATASAADTHRDSYYGTGGDPDAYGETHSRLAVVDTQLNHYHGRHTLSWGAQGSVEALDDSQPAYDRRFDLSYRNVGLYAQDDWSFAPRWQLLYGVRGDVHSALGRAVLSPRVALMHSPVPALDIRMSLARGFRAPQVFDEDLHLSSLAGEMRIVEVDPALREERSLNSMAGLEWKPELGAGQALLEVNAFHTALGDLFNVQEADDPATGAIEFRKVNAGRAGVYGVELNAGWGIGETFVLQGGIVEQRARFGEPEADFGSRDFFRSPRRYANATLTWKLRRLADVFAAVRYTGRMKAPHYAGFIDETRLETTPRFVVFDVSAARTFVRGAGAQLTVGVTARNVTNAYQQDIDRGPLRDASYVYGPRLPRSIGVHMRVEY